MELSSALYGVSLDRLSDSNLKLSSIDINYKIISKPSWRNGTVMIAVATVVASIPTQDNVLFLFPRSSSFCSWLREMGNDNLLNFDYSTSGD